MERPLFVMPCGFLPASSRAMIASAQEISELKFDDQHAKGFHVSYRMNRAESIPENARSCWMSRMRQFLSAKMTSLSKSALRP